MSSQHLVSLFLLCWCGVFLWVNVVSDFPWFQRTGSLFCHFPYTALFVWKEIDAYVMAIEFLNWLIGIAYHYVHETALVLNCTYWFGVTERISSLLWPFTEWILSSKSKKMNLLMFATIHFSYAFFSMDVSSGYQYKWLILCSKIASWWILVFFIKHICFTSQITCILRSENLFLTNRCQFSRWSLLPYLLFLNIFLKISSIFIYICKDFGC